MAKILYGIMGDSRGHVNRAQIITSEMPEHEYVLIGGQKTHELKRPGREVVDVPIPSTYYRDNRVDIAATVKNAAQVIFFNRPVVQRIVDVIKELDPDLILTDYEYFTPIAARRAGRPCISIDHQHVITQCLYDPPRQQQLSRLLTGSVIRGLYSKADYYLIISFFHLPPRDPRRAEVLPSVVKRSVTELSPSRGEHVLVYQTSPTFHRLLPVLEQIDRPFYIYGLGEASPRKNLIFKKPSEAEFLNDLASCAFVIANGGHNVLSEALFLGKPVFSFPIANAYEQFINAYHLEKLGYGRYSLSPTPDPRILIEFESKLADYEAAVSAGCFFGNDTLKAKLERMIEAGGPPDQNAESCG